MDALKSKPDDNIGLVEQIEKIMLNCKDITYNVVCTFLSSSIILETKRKAKYESRKGFVI